MVFRDHIDSGKRRFWSTFTAGMGNVESSLHDLMMVERFVPRSPAEPTYFSEISLVGAFGVKLLSTPLAHILC